MAVYPTPEIMAAAYDLLRTTLPFRGWHLPPSDDVKFCVTRHKDRAADYTFDGDHCIRVSQLKNQTLQTLLISIAHEMCHMKEWMSGARWDVHHGAAFNRLADRVCRVHLFDRGIF